jgi:hypothetical protein
VGIKDTWKENQNSEKTEASEEWSVSSGIHCQGEVKGMRTSKGFSVTRAVSGARGRWRLGSNEYRNKQGRKWRALI